MVSGFTLIELLIVVAIIAILAAIAVPNFLEAQVRSKVSRMRADMRTIATALEAYHVDANRYPPDGSITAPYWGIESYVPLTTPVAYVSSISRDIFQEKNENMGLGQGTYNYPCYIMIPNGRQLSALQNSIRFVWVVFSVGPDKKPNTFDYYPITKAYDPTNGTISVGDIGRLGP